MSFLASLQSFFDRGGIKLDLELPKSFKWADGVIPVTASVTGHKSEPRRITELLFVVTDDEKTDSESSTSGAGVRVDWAHRDEIELAPGETKQIEVAILLPAPVTREDREEQAFGREASGFLEKAFAAVAGGPSPESFNRYKVTAEASVAGVDKPKRTSKHIRQGRGHTVTIGGATTKF